MDSSTRLSLNEDLIPVDGALGLLAYGDIALIAWREKRARIDGLDWRRKLAHELAREENELKGEAEREVSERN